MLQAGVAQRMVAVTGGFASSVWRFDAAEHAYAVRAFSNSATLDREVLAIAAAARAGLPVPLARAVGSFDGRAAMLQDWAPGVPLLEALQREPWSILQLGYAFGRLQRRIHAVRAPSGLRDNWIDWPRGCDPALAEQLRSIARAGSLLHLDYHPLNVLALGGRLSAVIDWTNAHAGDPRADVARTLTIVRLAAPPSFAARVFELAWRAGYGSFGPHMSLFYAWAGSSMLDDLAGRDVGIDLERVRRWTERWRSVS